MRTRPLGASGLQTPVVILGAWSYGGWFWGKSEDETAVRTIHRAQDLGMVAIDTAPVYGMGHSEEVVGRALKERPGKAIVMTKCGLRWDDDRGEFDFTVVMPDGTKHPLYRNLRPDSIRHECEQSLTRLGLETIDLFQCHWPDPTTPIAETMGEMVRLYREGKIKAVGVSNFTPQMMDEAVTALGDVPLASDQPKYNLLARKIESDVVPFAREKNIGLIVYSPLEMGLLTGKVTAERSFGKGDLRAGLSKFSSENRLRVNRLIKETVTPMAEERGATVAQIVGAWVIGRPGITAAIIGARTPEQVEENARVGEIELGSKEMDVLTQDFQELKFAKPIAG